MNSSLVILALAVSVASGATFYESPHNERAAPFYKVPVQRDFSSPSQYFKPESASFYRPEAVQGFKPEPSFYNPSLGGYKSQYSGPQYSGGDHGYGQGARSFQAVRAGGHEYNRYF